MCTGDEAGDTDWKVRETGGRYDSVSGGQARFSLLAHKTGINTDSGPPSWADKVANISTLLVRTG